MDNIAEIKSRVSMFDICRYYGIQVNSKGYTRCVFHSDKTPSMKVYDNGTFHCFGCGANGDVIDFVKQHDCCTTQQAIENIGRGFGLNLDTKHKPSAKEMREANAKREQQKKDRVLNEAYRRAYEERYDKASKRLCEIVDRIKAIKMPAEGDFESAFERARLIREKEYLQYVMDNAEDKMNEYRNNST